MKLIKSHSYADAVPQDWPTAINPLVMASTSCVFCHGRGIEHTRVNRVPSVCGCVWRKIFRTVHMRYLTERDRTSSLGPVLEVGKRGKQTHARPNVEFVADYESVSTRSLTPVQIRIWQMHFVQGGDWKYCIERLQISKGEFWHQLYALQERLGRVFATVQPHRLWPTDEYFSTTVASISQVSGGRSTPRQILPFHRDIDIDKGLWPLPQVQKKSQQPRMLANAA